MAASPRSLISTTNVGTAGTRARLSTGTRRVRRIYVKAHAGNTGDVYFGDVLVSSTVGMSIDQANDDWHCIDFSPGTEKEDYWYADAATDGDKLDWYMIFEK
jgi:siroheme synthase (precorrin-2 oxidase/ferrochelatase)